MYRGETSHHVLSLQDLLASRHTDKRLLKLSPGLASYFRGRLGPFHLVTARTEHVSPSGLSEHMFKVPFPPSFSPHKQISDVKCLNSDSVRQEQLVNTEVRDKLVMSEGETAGEQPAQMEVLQSLGRTSNSYLYLVYLHIR